MSELRVADNFRTNSLSLEPGGYEVTVAYQNGQRLVYDKVKKPGYYIKSISSKNQEVCARCHFGGLANSADCGV